MKEKSRVFELAPGFIVGVARAASDLAERGTGIGNGYPRIYCPGEIMACTLLPGVRRECPGDCSRLTPVRACIQGLLS